ncbi:hypothetical protein FRC11_013815 [Ceratobasidium sp. 423]|nr:hypothetical protein FRC11_013815 [Ceratobasidium sp. 423]
MSSGSAPTPAILSTPHLGPLSGASVDTNAEVSNSESSRTEQIMRGSRQHTTYFSTNAAGEMTLIVPYLNSLEAVKDFLSDALNSKELARGVRVVKCSLCKNKKAAKFWNIKPSNLERHIKAHLGIKSYPSKKHPGTQLIT